MTDNLELQMDAYLPLRDVVFQTLRGAILRGELKPGERLMEIQLANKLGVSRTPIREAIRKLELEGLVLMIPRKGAEVADISEKSMKDVLEVRHALDELSVELACERISKAQIKELELAAIEFKKTLKSKDVTVIAEADVKFHDVIYTATNNQKLINLLNKIREQMYRYRVEYLKNPQNHEQLLKEHEAIYKGIVEKDKKAVTEMIRRHISNQVTVVKNMIREQEK